jgi:hypothetical protein
MGLNNASAPPDDVNLSTATATAKQAQPPAPFLGMERLEVRTEKGKEERSTVEWESLTFKRPCRLHVSTGTNQTSGRL